MRKEKAFIPFLTLQSTAVCVRTPAVKQLEDLLKKAILMFRKGILHIQGRVICIRYTKYEPPPVQQMLTNNLKGFEQKQVTNRNIYKNRFVGVCGGNLKES